MGKSLTLEEMKERILRVLTDAEPNGLDEREVYRQLSGHRHKELFRQAMSELRKDKKIESC